MRLYLSRLENYLNDLHYTLICFDKYPTYLTLKYFISIRTVLVNIFLSFLIWIPQYKSSISPTSISVLIPATFYVLMLMVLIICSISLQFPLGNSDHMADSPYPSELIPGMALANSLTLYSGSQINDAIQCISPYPRK